MESSPAASHHFLPAVPQVDEIKATLSNDEQKLGADIIRKALAYPIRLIASNAGVNGSVVMNKVGFRGGTGAGGQVVRGRCLCGGNPHPPLCLQCRSQQQRGHEQGGHWGEGEDGLVGRWSEEGACVVVTPIRLLAFNVWCQRQCGC